MADDREVVARALCSHWSSEHEEPNDFDFAGADRVLAALAGRIPPEVDGSITQAAYRAFRNAVPADEWVTAPYWAALDAALQAAAPLIAAATERRVREECAKLKAQNTELAKAFVYMRDKISELPQSVWRDVHRSINTEEAAQAIDDYIAELQAAIRTGAVS